MPPRVRNVCFPPFLDSVPTSCLPATQVNMMRRGGWWKSSNEPSQHALTFSIRSFSISCLSICRCRSSAELLPSLIPYTLLSFLELYVPKPDEGRKILLKRERLPCSRSRSPGRRLDSEDVFRVGDESRVVRDLNEEREDAPRITGRNELSAL